MKDILVKESILLNQEIGSKEEAIRMAGELLVRNGYVKANYIEEMLKREDLSTTYIGNDIAIPHGTESAKDEVLTSGISVIQVPNGVDFNGEKARVIFGIAGKDNTHIDILSNIAIICSEMENVEKIVAAKSKEEIISMFEGVE